MEIIKENHKEQLTVKDLEQMISALKAAYGKSARDIPVYIGDDDELNGIHCAWCVDHVPIAKECNDDENYCRELINEASGNNAIGDTEVAIVIS